MTAAVPSPVPGRQPLELDAWCAWRESNPLPCGPEPHALSSELQAPALTAVYRVSPSHGAVPAGGGRGGRPAGLRRIGLEIDGGPGPEAAAPSSPRTDLPPSWIRPRALAACPGLGGSPGGQAAALALHPATGGRHGLRRDGRCRRAGDATLPGLPRRSAPGATPGSWPVPGSSAPGLGYGSGRRR